MIEEKKIKKDNNGWAGLVLIIAGCALLAYKMGYYIPEWIFSWQMLLIVLGILSGIKNRFRGTGWIALIIIGAAFLAERIIPEYNFRGYIFPAVIIIAGLFLVFRPKIPGTSCRKQDQAFNSDATFTKIEEESMGNVDPLIADPAAPQQEKPMRPQENGDYFRVHSIFSGINRSIFSKNFQGGTISCIFGGTEIDLSQADFQDKAVIKIEQVFGGTKLIVPAHWTVQNQIEGVFHSVDDGRRNHHGSAFSPGKQLILKGSCVFAGVEIKSY